MKTVGELKEYIKDLDDDMLLLKRSSNFELKGAIDEGIFPHIRKFKLEKQAFIDGFDYESYYHDVYVEDNNGVECLQIS